MPCRSHSLALVALIAWATIPRLATAGPAVRIETQSGEQATDSLHELGDDRLVLAGDDGERAWPLDELATIEITGGDGAANPPTKSSLAAVPADWLTLVDGTLLRTDQITIAGDQITALGAGGEWASLPAALVRSVRFASASADEDAAWRQFDATEDVAADRLIVRKQGRLEMVEGVVGNVTAEQVAFTVDGDALEVRRGKVAGAIFLRTPLAAATRRIGTARLADGSALALASLRWADNAWRVTTPAGWQTVLPGNLVRRIELTAGKSVFLSDLTPQSTEWSAYFAAPAIADVATFFQPRRDENFQGSSLTIDGRAYPKGLALHSRTTIAYRLGGEYRRFQSQASIDASAGRGGHVRLVISGDERTLCDVTIAAGQPAESLDLDVSGVRRLSVLVDFGENLDIGDQLLLCPARLSP